MIRMADPLLLLLLVVVPPVAWWMWRQRQSLPRMTYSSLALLRGVRPTLRTRLAGLPRWAALLSFVLLIVAMARPQSAWREHERFAEGIAIMLVLDVSYSMMADDFSPNRLEKAKQVVKDFIDARRNDQLGLVIFGRETFTLCPLTLDYPALKDFVDRIDFQLLDGRQTAIGLGLANAVDKLRVSDTKSKVVILLTDGENNAGRISPASAARIAREFAVRTYTIGVGSDHALFQIPNPFGGRGPVTVQSSLDVEQLRQIAETTGGQFFRATNDLSLERIYDQIDRMERTRIEVDETHYFDEVAHWLMLPALALLALGFLLELTWLRSFP